MVGGIRLKRCADDGWNTRAASSEYALRGLVDAIIIYPGQKRGEVSIELRGDLAAFMHLADAQVGPDGKVAVQTGGYGEVLGTLVAGTRNNREFTLPVVAC